MIAIATLAAAAALLYMACHAEIDNIPDDIPGSEEDSSDE